MQKTSNLIQTAFFGLFIAVFFLLFLVLPDVGFSAQENRELTQAPKLTAESLFGGQFATKFESYTNDQFPFRDSWTTVKAASELISGKKENKGVYICEGETLVEAYKAPSPAQLETNIEAVNSLASNASIPVYFCLVPGVSEINSDILPKNAPNDSQKAIIDYAYSKSGALNIDMYGALKPHADEYIFYRTDHHWTSLGAFYGYEVIMNAMGRASAPLSDFNRRIVSEEFFGTIYSKSGMSWLSPDEIEIFADQDEGIFVYNYLSEDDEVTGIYDFTMLEKKDKYSMFMGGISPLIRVVSGNTDGKRLLVLRDSYADSLVPFIQSEFAEIHMMDLRYYKTQLYDSSLTEYIAENGIDEVLVIYSTGNFGTDVNVVLMGQ